MSVQPNQPSISGPTELGRLVLVGARRKLLAEIVDSLMQGTQFLALTGAPGVGKIRRDELDRVDFSDVTAGERLPNVTPGEVLREEFLVPLGMSARALARDLGVPANRITEILNGGRAVSAATAILLSRRFGTSPEFWMNLQTAHDVEAARQAMAA